MKISRRKFLLSSAALGASLEAAKAQVGVSREETKAAGFNGKKVQFNMDFAPGVGGSEIPFMNLLASRDLWRRGSSALFNMNFLDSSGWLKPGAGGWSSAFYMPTEKERSGTYYLLGRGRCNIRVFSNHGTAGPFPTSGNWSIPLTGLPRIDNNFILGLEPTTSPHATNIAIVHKDDLADYAAGEIFDKQFISRARNFGVIRFMNWQLANFSNAVNADDVVPTTSGNYSYWFDHSKWAVGGFVRNATDRQAYTCNFPDFVLTNNRCVFAEFDTDSAADGAVCTSIIAGVTTRLKLDRPVNWSVGSQIGVNRFKPAGSGTQPIMTDMCQRAWKLLALESGGTVAVLDVNTNGHGVAAIEAFGVGPVFSLNINGTGAKPLRSPIGSYMVCTTGTPNNYAFVKKSMAKVIFDSQLDCYLCFVSTWPIDHPLGLAVPQMTFGIPFDVMIDLCNKVGAHPWFACPVMACNTQSDNPRFTELSDYIPTLIARCKTRLNPGLIPRFEAGNELFLYHTFNASYADAHVVARNGYSNFYDQPNWVGYATSMIGQLCANKYEYTMREVKDQQKCQVMIPMASSYGFYGPITSSNTAAWPCGASTLLVSKGGSAAYNWANRICFADYWVSSQYTSGAGDPTENAIADAFVAEKNPAAKAAIANDYINKAYLAGPIETAYTFTDLYPGGKFGAIFARFKDLATDKAKWGGGFKICLYEGSWNAQSGGTPKNTVTFRLACREYDKVREISLHLWHKLCDDGIGEFPSVYLLAAPEASIWAATWPNSYAPTRPIYDAVLEYNGS